jgi:site-specific DNA-methyltransferase (adenine-specific)
MVELINGDCIKKMKNIPSKSIDLILCDLPDIKNNNIYSTDKTIPLNKLWKQYNRIIKDNGVIVLFSQEPYSSLLRISNLKMYKYDFVWVKDTKTNFMNCNYQPLNNLEYISVFSKATACKSDNIIKYNPQFTIENNSKIYPYNTLFYDTVKPSKKIHPQEKPIDLLEYLIKTFTDKNDLVLDNCMGSGSTGIACINTNRNFIGIEKDKNYYIKASNRIEDYKNSILLTQAVNVTVDYINEDYEEYDENYDEEENIEDSVQDFEINCFELPKRDIEDISEDIKNDEIQLGNNYFFRKPEQLDKVEFISFKKPYDEYSEPFNSERFENIFEKERFYEEKPLERK